MIIDDDPDIISLTRLSLKDRVETVWATDSATAIEKIARYEPDILLLDIMMPKFSGYQLLQVIRRNPFFKSLPVIIISAKSSKREVDYAKRMGANEYLPKPFSPSDLVRMVETFIASAGFAIRKKKLLYQTILASESAKEESPFEKIDDEHRFIAKSSRDEIQKFIDTHMPDDEDSEDDEK